MRFIPKILLPLFLLIFYYVGHRLYGFLKQFFPKIKKLPFFTVYAVFPLCFVIYSYLPVSVFAKIVTVIGNVYLSFFMFAIMLLVPAEVIRLILFLARRLPQGEKRRKIHILAGSVICVLLVAIVCGGMINAFTIRATDYELEIKKQSGVGSLKIVAVSDIHLGYQIGSGHLENMVEKINAQNPDIVCIVGDIFDRSTDMVFDISEATKVLSRIQSKYGVFSVLGNHDVYTRVLEAFFAESNVTLLKNESVLIDDSFYIVGRNDRNILTGDRYGRVELSEIMKDLDKSKPIIVLDHRPQSFEEARENGADLVLSGHSHAGQVFPANLITKMVYTTDYGYGVYGDTQVVVTSGVGLWGPPIRVGTRAEIAVINVSFSN